jgi:hypothetical protein
MTLDDRDIECGLALCAPTPGNEARWRLAADMTGMTVGEIYLYLRDRAVRRHERRPDVPAWLGPLDYFPEAESPVVHHTRSRRGRGQERDKHSPR